MCTVTYIPQSGRRYIFTTNRDENAARSPQSLSSEQRSGQELLFPRDTLAGGTWIAVSDSDRTVCLLNGAFEAHQRRTSYRRSRGLMALDFFDYPDTDQFAQAYEFDAMEPFTMIIVERGRLTDLRWDERRLYVQPLDPADFHIWSSATLYDQTAREKREKWFRDWRRGRTEFSREAILEFHRTAGEGDPWNDVVMNRNGVVQTVSITSICRTGRHLDMRYQSLLNDQVISRKIPLKGEVLRHA